MMPELKKLKIGTDEQYVDWKEVLRDLHGGILSILDNAVTSEILVAGLQRKLEENSDDLDMNDMEMLNNCLNEIWEDSEILADLSDLGFGGEDEE